MNTKLIEKLFDLFDDYQSRGLCLEINIEKDLLKIFPLPKILLLDLLSEEFLSTISYISEDKNRICFQNNLRLCSIDQNQGDSCHSSSCEQLHICRDFILNKTCLQFLTDGKCKHSHSLSTEHNLTILNKFHLNKNVEHAFQFISRIIRISLAIINQPKIIIQSKNGQKISEDLIYFWLDQHKELLVEKKILDSFTVELTFDDEEVASMMENLIMEQHSTTVLVGKDIISKSNSQLSYDNKSEKIIPVKNKQLSNTTNERLENDLDREVELANGQTSTGFDRPVPIRPKRNDINPILNKSSSSLPGGRGRGRQLLHPVPPPAPSFSKKTSSPLSHTQSPQSGRKIFSQRLSSTLSTSNDQLSSIGFSSNNEKKFSFSQRLNSTTNDHLSKQIKPKSTDTSSSSTPEMNPIDSNYISDQFSHEIKTESSIKSSSSIPRRSVEQNNHNENHYHIYSPHSDVPNEIISSPVISPTSSDGNSKTHFVLRRSQTKTEEKSPVSTNQVPLSRNRTAINYNYNKQFTDEHLCYLLGPGREQIKQNDQLQILSYLPSGYCRVTNIQEGKDIEKELYAILPDTLNIEPVQCNEESTLIMSSAAAENIFQENQMDYAIISEPSRAQLNIEVIHSPANERRQSTPTSPRDNASSSIEVEVDDTNQFFSNGKFHVSTTDSSIDVISGDISQIPVDLMICISTSNNLRESVLRRAGAKTESEYDSRYRPTDALLLDGGSTSARKILFVPWQTEIEQTEITQIQKSLSDLVRWCIDQAHERKLKSISFPPIGTGQLNLDPALVCEAMISAATERLHQFKMDVLFIIYQSSGVNNDDECYQVFKMYLESLCEQIKPIKAPRTRIKNERRISKNSDTKKQVIRRYIQGKRILTLSDIPDIVEHHKLLIKSLENLMYEKSFDLSLIESSLMNQFDLLIDVCLKSNVIPRIDLSREELRLRGDRDSCFQCFFNLREGKKVHQYSYVLTQNGENNENKINSFISLKIDEAFAVGESNIIVKNNDQISYNIDLNKFQVQINRDRQSAFLVKKELNADCKIRIPSSWSLSFLMIQIVEMKKSSFESLECFRAFEETMSTSDWQIERIDSIENYPLYIHFMKGKNEETKLYFHGCTYSSVQSIIHYGLHSTNVSNYGDQFVDSSMGSICLTRDVLNSHLYGTRRSTDGKHYIFAVQLAKKDRNNTFILLSNNDAHLALPTYLITYQRRKHFH